MNSAAPIRGKSNWGRTRNKSPAGTVRVNPETGVIEGVTSEQVKLLVKRTYRSDEWERAFRV